MFYLHIVVIEACVNSYEQMWFRAYAFFEDVTPSLRPKLGSFHVSRQP